MLTRFKLWLARRQLRAAIEHYNTMVRSAEYLKRCAIPELTRAAQNLEASLPEGQNG